MAMYSTTSSMMSCNMSMPMTFSTCDAGTVQGKHVFRIDGYSQDRGTGEGCMIRSGVFFVGGHRWFLAFNPLHFITEIRDFVSVALMLFGVKGGPRARASYELSLIDQSTKMPVLVHKEPPRMFEPDPDVSTCVSYLQKKNRSMFESPRFLRNDCLIMEVVVSVFKELGTTLPETRLIPKIEVPPSDIGEQFGKLLETKEGADVAFIVGGETFSGHKIVLATRSSVFKAQLYGPLRKEGTEPTTIEVEDLQPSVFQALLYFIYTDSLPAMDNNMEIKDRFEMICQLLVAADQYAIERLKVMCQSILSKNLQVQNVATTLALADEHHCDKLKDACIEFMACSNAALDAVVETQGYKNLKINHPSIVIEALEKASRVLKAYDQPSSSLLILPRPHGDEQHNVTWLRVV